MNLFELYAKISLDTKDYEKEVKKASQEGEKLKENTKSIGDETKKSSSSLSDFAKKLSRSFSDSANSSKTAKNEVKVLQQQYKEAKATANDLADAFNKSAKQTGYSSDATKKLAKELKDAKKKAADLKSELSDMGANKFEQQLGKIKKSLTDTFSAKNITGALGGGLKTGLSMLTTGVGVVAGVATAAGGALLALEANTEEYRIAQGKLNTAFEAAGYSGDVAKQVYTDFYKILGDTDTATEASQLLASLALNAEDMSTWTNIAAGVYGTFGDALPIEGLIESANETAKVGEVTGLLADALNWAGISEDEFNAKLAACSTESERNQLIMDTLSGTYDTASEAFYNNNEELVKARENQAKVDESLAKLGEQVTKQKNRFINEFTPSIAGVIDALVGMMNGTENAEEAFADSITEMINNFIDRLPEFLAGGVEILMALATGIVQAIPDLVEKIPEIVQAMIDAFIEAWPQFKEAGSKAISALWDGLKSAWSGVVSWFEGVWDSVFGNRTANVTVNKRVTGTSGSHAGGLTYVPYNGYLAELHEGEQVLTKAQASQYRNGGGSYSGPINITVNAAQGQSETEIAQHVARILENERERRAAAFG